MFFVFRLTYFKLSDTTHSGVQHRAKATVGSLKTKKHWATIAIGADLSASIGGRTNQTARATTTQLLCRSDLYLYIYLICKTGWPSYGKCSWDVPARRSETRCDHTKWCARPRLCVPMVHQGPSRHLPSPNHDLRCYTLRHRACNHSRGVGVAKDHTQKAPQKSLWQICPNGVLFHCCRFLVVCPRYVERCKGRALC